MKKTVLAFILAAFLTFTACGGPSYETLGPEETYPTETTFPQESFDARLAGTWTVADVELTWAADVTDEDRSTSLQTMQRKYPGTTDEARLFELLEADYLKQLQSTGKSFLLNSDKTGSYTENGTETALTWYAEGTMVTIQEEAENTDPAQFEYKDGKLLTTTSDAGLTFTVYMEQATD